MGKKNKIIQVQTNDITIARIHESDYISLTDMANAKDGGARAADIIKNWIRTRSTLEFLGVWEQMNNPGFKVVEFDHFKSQAGLLTRLLSYVCKRIDQVATSVALSPAVIPRPPRNLVFNNKS